MRKSIAVFILILLLFGIASPAGAVPPTYNTWYPTSTGIEIPVDVTAFAFSPSYAGDHTVYAGTYGGVYRSTDSGFHWTPIGTTAAESAGSINSLAVSPNYASDKTLFVGTSTGVLMISNADTAAAGTDWVDITNDIGDSDVLVIAFSPDYAADKTLFAGTFGYGMYKTTNINGASTSWSVAGNELNATSSRIRSIVFTPDYATSHTLFVGVDGGDRGGVNKSTDGGASWTPATNGMLPDDPLHRNVMALAISPVYLTDHTLFAGLYSGQGVFKSTNGGESWSWLPGTENAYVQALAISPSYAVDQTLFYGGDGGGVNVSTSGGASWAGLNAGFNGDKSVLALAIPPTQRKQPFNLFAGTFSDQVWQMLYGKFQVYVPFIHQ
ncbi:MAG: hypothetical protein M1281_00710 [Chloroflexi bacterium]|nr:hypothetical protein [Chloroflexota bacterium]